MSGAAMYSPSSPDFDLRCSSSTITEPVRNSHKRSGSASSSSSLMMYWNQQITPPSSPKTSSPPTTPKRRYPQSEKRLMQAHDITRAIFACTPCHGLRPGGGNPRQRTMRPGIGSYYLPSDIFDEDDVYDYCGIEAVEVIGEDGTSAIPVMTSQDYVATLEQDYEMSRA